MTREEKVRFIEETLGFLLDAPLMETANAFPSPDDFIEDWYLTAAVFQKVRVENSIPDEHREALNLLIEDAIAEYKAAKMLGEEPDTDEELGVGYDGYEIPENFAAQHQATVWKFVRAVFDTDERPPALTIVG